jgi:hypothetical protein
MIVNARSNGNVQWRFVAGRGSSVSEQTNKRNKYFLENLSNTFQTLLLRNTPGQKEVLVHPPPFANLAHKIG